MPAITLRNIHWDNGVWVDARIANGSQTFEQAAPAPGTPMFLNINQSWTINGADNQDLLYKREANPGERPIRYSGQTRDSFHTHGGMVDDI